MFSCVLTIVSACSSSVLLEPGVLELRKFRQSPGDTFFWAKTVQELPATVTRATIAGAMADETAREQATADWHTRPSLPSGTLHRRRLARYRNCIVA